MSRTGKLGNTGFKIKESDRILPDNVIGYHGVYIRNLDKNITKETLNALFERFGRIVSCRTVACKTMTAGYVDYDNTESPRQAIKVFQGVVTAGLSEKSAPLFLHFAPSKAQPAKMIHLPGQRRTWSSEECYYWRTTGCDVGFMGCTKKHHPICRGVDFQPSMTNTIKF